MFTKDNAHEWPRVFSMLLELAKKKPWIREECGWVIMEALDQMDQSTAEETLARIQQEGLASTPEGVGIWLRAKSRFPDMKFPPKPWGSNGNPLEHLKDLAKALKESSSPADEKKTDQVKQTGNWNPQLHFAWDLVLSKYIQEGANSKEAQKAFEHFWRVAVDENLFSDNASPQRRFWGFSLFQRMLVQTADISGLLKRIFSPNLVRSLINHASQNDRFLHRSAVKSLKVMVQVAEGSPAAINHMIKGIVSTNAYNFDRITKSKTIDGMLSFANAENAEAITQALLEPVVVLESEDVKEAESRRQLFGDYLLAMIRRTNMSDESVDNSWIQNSILPVLADFAYSTKGYAKKCKPEISEITRTLFRNRLSSAFAHILSGKSSFSYPCELLKSLKPNAVSMDAAVLESKDKAFAIMEKLLSKLSKATDKRKKTLQTLAVLYALMIFQLYNGEADALSVLDELKICYDKLIRGKDTEAIDASEILVEILLSLISRQSKLLKKVGQLVFEAFASEMSAGGLKLMLDVLESSESLEGQESLFDKDDDMIDENEDDGDDDEDSDDDEMDSDVEVIDAEDVEGDDDAEDEDDDEEGDDEEAVDEDPATAEENQRLDAALEAALGTHRLDKDKDAADTEDSDADMTDSEMLELDNKLIEIFREQKKSASSSKTAKKEKKDARENIINFKRGVLDLLEIYVKAQPAQSFELLVPLLTLIRTTTSKDEVAKNAHAVVNTYLTSSKKIDVTDRAVSNDTLLSALEAVQAEAGKESSNPSQAFAKACSTASLILAGSLYRREKEGSNSGKKILKKIVGGFGDLRIRSMLGEVKVHPTFFREWENWCQNVAAANASA